MTLRDFDELPAALRRCLYWELAPQSRDLSNADTSGGCGTDPAAAQTEFDKEAWFSHLSLEWGCCAQLLDDGTALRGGVVYVPPSFAPRSALQPAGPVSPDAILIAGLTAPSPTEDVELLSAAANDLQRRGVRAIEAYGRRIDCVSACDFCCAPSEVALLAADFTVIADDPQLPRLRLELEPHLMWKADVERALDQIVATALEERNVTSGSANH